MFVDLHSFFQMIQFIAATALYGTGIYAGSPASLRRKPSPESTTPQFRTLLSAWLFSDGSAPVE